MSKFGILSIFVIYAVLPVPEYRIGESETNPGRRNYWFKATDPCGNYEGNYILVKIDVNGPEGIYSYVTYGLSVWDDPNYLVIDTAVYDPDRNSPDVNEPNDLSGWFNIEMNLRHYDYQIIIQAFDQAANSSIGEMIINSKDRGKPKITDFGKER